MMRRNAGRVHVRGNPLRVAAEKLQPLVSLSYLPNQSNTWRRLVYKRARGRH